MFYNNGESDLHALSIPDINWDTREKQGVQESPFFNKKENSNLFKA